MAITDEQFQDLLDNVSQLTTDLTLLEIAVQSNEAGNQSDFASIASSIASLGSTISSIENTISDVTTDTGVNSDSISTINTSINSLQDLLISINASLNTKADLTALATFTTEISNLQLLVNSLIDQSGSTTTIFPSSTEVAQSNSTDVVASGSHILDVIIPESLVEGYKKEYSIVGDGLYASVNTDEAPEWLTSIIDSVTANGLSTSLGDLVEARNSIQLALQGLNVAENNYTQAITVISNIDEVIAAEVETLNATIDGNKAEIIDILGTKVTSTEATAFAIEQIEASITDPDGAIKTSVIDHFDTAIANQLGTFSDSVDALESSYENNQSQLSANATAITGLQTYVGLDEEGVPNATGMLSRIEILENQNDGVVEHFTGSHSVMQDAEDTSSPEDDELILTAEPYASWLAEDTLNGDTAVRTSHIGDVYIQYDLNGSYLRSYKFIVTAQDTTEPFATDSEGFTWALVTNTDAAAAYAMALTARDLADGKRRVFTTTPTVPYDKGDLWVDSSVSPQIVKVSEHTRSAVYSASDWVQADQQAQDFITNTYSADKTSLQNQLDGVIEYSFYDSCTDITDPATTEGALDESIALDIIDNAWATAAQREAANGNVVYFKDTRNAYWYQSSTPAWISITDTSIYEALQDAAEAKGAADGKVSQFYAWGGSEPPADYSIVTTPQVLDDDGVTVLQEAVSTSYSGSEFIFWYKSDGSLYYKSNNEWVTVPTTPGEINYIAAGDVLTVLDPTNNDLTSYTYNGTSWQQVGPTNIISKSKFFVDLENEVLGDYGTVASSISSLETRSQAYADDEGARVENNFAYNSAIKLGNSYYRSGFGLNATGIDQTANGETPDTAYDSEFWVNAKRFVLSNPDYPDVKASFTVTDGSITLGVEHTEATKNVPQGTYSSSSTYGLGDIVTYNNSSYVALKTITDVTPNNDGINWQLLALKGDTPLVFEWSGDSSWPTSTTEANALEYSFESSFSGTAIVRVLAYDAEGNAEGGVRIKFNGSSEIPFTRTLGNNTQEWYEFTFDTLVAGTNTIKFWSDTSDGGTIKTIEVAFAGAKGLDGAYTDFLFTRNADTPADPGGTDIWYTNVVDVPAGSGDLWSIKKIVSAGGASTSYVDKRVIDAPIIREITIYSNATTGTPTAPTDSTYDFSADSLSIGTNPEGFTWSRSLSGISSTGEKIYATTALVTGNATQTSVSITWGDVVVYTQRQDGVSYSGTTEYYRLTSSSTAPDRYSEGTTIHTDWTTTPSTPTSTNKYLWNFNRNSRSDGTFDDSSVSLITQYVQDGNAITSIVEKYQLSTSATVAPTDTWSDTIADAGALSKDYPYLWNQTTISYSQTTDDVITSLIAARGADGANADALTVTASKEGSTTTLSFSDGTSATIEDGSNATSYGVKPIYAEDASGTNASFEQGTLEYVNYYEWSGTAPTEVPSGLTYVKYVGEDGDAQGVIPIYSNDPNGTTTSFEYTGQEYVNFYEWTTTAPTEVPTGLTYTKFVGTDGVSYTGTTEYYQLTDSETAPDRYSSGTTIDTGWGTSPSSPTSNNRYLWNFNRNSRSDGSFDDSSVSLITSMVKSISSITEEYQLGTSATTAPTGVWYTSVSNAGAISDTNPYLWNKTVIAYTDGSDSTTTYTLIAAKGIDGLTPWGSTVDYQDMFSVIIGPSTSVAYSTSYLSTAGSYSLWSGGNLTLEAENLTNNGTDAASSRGSSSSNSAGSDVDWIFLQGHDESGNDYRDTLDAVQVGTYIKFAASYGSEVVYEVIEKSFYEYSSTESFYLFKVSHIKGSAYVSSVGGGVPVKFSFSTNKPIPGAGFYGESYESIETTDSEISTRFRTLVGRLPIYGDVFTQTDTSTTPPTTSTKLFNGSGWGTPSLVVTGDMVVEGTIGADKLIANSITADQIAAGGITAENLHIDDKITLGDDNSALTAGKTNLYDTGNAGVYLGRTGNLSGITIGDANSILKATSNGQVSLLNATLYKEIAYSYDETVFNTSTPAEVITVDVSNLAPGTPIYYELQGAGGNGGGAQYSGAAGGETYLRITKFDSTIDRIYAYGGNGGQATASLINGQYTPVDPMYDGSVYPNGYSGESSTFGAGGAGGIYSGGTYVFPTKGESVDMTLDPSLVSWGAGGGGSSTFWYTDSTPGAGYSMYMPTGAGGEAGQYVTGIYYIEEGDAELAIVAGGTYNESPSNPYLGGRGGGGWGRMYFDGPILTTGINLNKLYDTISFVNLTYHTYAAYSGSSAEHLVPPDGSGWYYISEVTGTPLYYCKVGALDSATNRDSNRLTSGKIIWWPNGEDFSYNQPRSNGAYNTALRYRKLKDGG